jgi:hypothetical protein
VSSPDREDFGNDLLAAKERDLKPLLEEGEEDLGLDYDQVEALEDYLNLAWFSGLRAGQAQMDARATEKDPDIRAIAVRHFEADVKDLMEQSANMLGLSLTDTIAMWSLLHQAWMNGNRTCEAELMGLYLAMQGDVAEEARQWLEEKGDAGKGDKGQGNP